MTDRGIPQCIADQNGAIVEQAQAIATPSRCGVAWAQPAAAVEAIMIADSVVGEQRGLSAHDLLLLSVEGG